MKQITKNSKGIVTKVQHMPVGPTKTQQHMAAATDVNNIIARYKKNPDPSIFIKSGQGVYGDFSQIQDFQSAIHKVEDALQNFMQLPAKLRASFDNDPSKLMSYLKDPKNKKEAQEYGLIKPDPKIPDPTQPEIAKDPK